MEKVIDARGLTCPAPVLKTRDTLAAESLNSVTVLVDNQAAQENVARFLGSQGYVVETVAEGTDFRLIGRHEGDALVALDDASMSRFPQPAEGEEKTLVLIMTDKMGRGDDVLGGKLLINYIKTLKEMGPALWQLVFVNGGVRLTCRSSPVLAEIQEYEAAGTTVLSCGTCMEHFGITAEKAVGGLTNMLDIVMATQNADKVVTLS